MTGIYKIESKISLNKIYIGSAVNIAKRWRLHINELAKNKHGNRKLQSHYNKYGLSDLQFSILLGCDRVDLIKVEQYFIDSYKPWFNICQKAGSRLGVKHSIESKIKNRDKHLGKIPWNKGLKLPSLSEEHKIKIGESGKGKKHKAFSKETRHKQSLAHIGHIPWNKGKKGIYSIETLKKMRDSGQGKKVSEETKRKIKMATIGENNGMYGKTHSLETRKKMSDIRIAKFSQN